MNALVFPGQGSQRIGMARMMVQTFPWAAELAQKADHLLNRSLTKIIFEGPEESLKQTINTQPALFLTEAILAEWIKREAIPFTATAGHSLGEYAALFAAGAASFTDLLGLVQLRAKAMEEAAPQGSGAMAAILMLDRHVVIEICHEASALGPCVLANVNCPGQVVISGAAAAVAKAGDLAKAKGARRVVPLEVSGPFHSPLMEPARERLQQAMTLVAFRDTETSVYQNIDATSSRQASIFPGKLLNQLTGTVRWEDQILAMHREGIRTFIELGPGKVLSGMIKKILPDVRVLQAEDPDTLSQLALQAHT